MRRRLKQLITFFMVCFIFASTNSMQTFAASLVVDNTNICDLEDNYDDYAFAVGDTITHNYHQSNTGYDTTDMTITYYMTYDSEESVEESYELGSTMTVKDYKELFPSADQQEKDAFVKWKASSIDSSGGNDPCEIDLYPVFDYIQMTNPQNTIVINGNNAKIKTDVTTVDEANTSINWYLNEAEKTNKLTDISNIDGLENGWLFKDNVWKSQNNYEEYTDTETVAEMNASFDISDASGISFDYMVYNEYNDADLKWEIINTIDNSIVFTDTINRNIKEYNTVCRSLKAGSYKLKISFDNKWGDKSYALVKNLHIDKQIGDGNTLSITSTDSNYVSGLQVYATGILMSNNQVKEADITATAKLTINETPIEITDSKIDSGVPVGTVSGIDSAYNTIATENNKGYTAADKAIVDAGGKALIYLKAEETTGTTAGTTVIDKKIAADGRTRGTLLNLDVFKEITAAGASIPNRTQLIELPSVIAVTIDIPEAQQGKSNYAIYRYHEGGVDVITTTPNADGEYIEITADGKHIILHAKKFSEYALAYKEISTGGNANTSITPTTDTTNINDKSPNAGENIPIGCLFALVIVSGSSLVILGKKKKVVK